MLPAITFSVQVGSDGFAIARAVATELGYKYYDWQITTKAASLVGPVPGDLNTADFADRILGRLSAAAVLEEEVPSGFIGPSPSLLEHALRSLSRGGYRNAIEEVVRQIAAEGEAVIVGHTSQIVLRDWPGVLKVLVRGSFEQRAARLATEQRITRHEATKMVIELDQMRRDFFDHVYNVDWLDSSLHDLTINTDQIPTAAAVQMIVTAVCGGGPPAFDFKPRPTSDERRPRSRDARRHHSASEIPPMSAAA